jgi:tRNA modification GTPase
MTELHNQIATIYALASAAGRAGVSVVRVSGPLARESLLSLVPSLKLRPRMAHLVKLTNPVSRETIDQALVLYFNSPASYTGEDVVEYHLHGSRAVVDALLNYLSKQPGHRMAEAGEFTRRAFENGKMDLTAAEAVADLIDAETEAQQQLALDQLGGSLSNLYEDWAARLSKALAYLEADIDFPDEDLPDGVAAQVRPVIEELLTKMGSHLNDNRRGERLRDGIQVAVIGAPNAGKSSLVNILAQRDVAIVSDQAGTTRDIIEVHLNLGGFPVIIADTAGLRPDQMTNKGHDLIESEGMRRALARAEQADIQLLIFDGASLPHIDPHSLALVNEKTIIGVNKIDVNPNAIEQLEAHLRGAFGASNAQGRPVIGFSVSRETGLEALGQILVDQIREIMGQYRAQPSLTRARHRTALEDCRVCLTRAMTAPLPELMAEDVRLAQRALGRITGRVHVEELLDIIFGDFCIGK